MAVNEPIDYTSTVGQVRLLVGDVTDPFIFQDEQIEGFLTLAGGNIKRASASALLVIAGNEALLYKYVRTDDLLVDGPKVAAELRQQADDLKEEAAADAEVDYEHFRVDFTGDCCDWEYKEYTTVKPWSGDPCPW